LNVLSIVRWEDPGSGGLYHSALVGLWEGVVCGKES
jgi:hypothetical protein